MKSYFCPKCGAEIPLSDINVSADLMLCKSCGETSAPSEPPAAEQPTEG